MVLTTPAPSYELILKAGSRVSLFSRHAEEEHEDLARRSEIEAALRRFEDDEYGECVECGDYINPRRLEARPAASMCIGCQEEVEALGRRQLSRPGLIDEYM